MTGYANLLGEGREGGGGKQGALWTYENGELQRL